VGGQGHGQGHYQQPGHGHADEYCADHDSPDVQDEDRGGADANQNDRVHDPLDDHGAQRGAAADAFAVAQIVAPHQLAESGRQDVVG
jgi:hypothetical protein